MPVCLLFLRFAGINTVMYYSGTILHTAGFSTSLAIWRVAVLALFNFVFTAVGMLLVDRWGRRKLVLVSLVGVITALVVLGIVFVVQHDVSWHNAVV